MNSLHQNLRIHPCVDHYWGPGANLPCELIRANSPTKGIMKIARRIRPTYICIYRTTPEVELQKRPEKKGGEQTTLRSEMEKIVGLTFPNFYEMDRNGMFPGQGRIRQAKQRIVVESGWVVLHRVCSIC